MNEDVGERCCGVPDVGGLVEQTEQLSDALVQYSGIVIGVGLAVLVELLLPGIDGSLIGFIIDDKQRHSRHVWASLVARVRRKADPFEQVLEHTPVLLDHEEERMSPWIDSKILGYVASEIAVVRPSRYRVGLRGRVDHSDADRDDTADGP